MQGVIARKHLTLEAVFAQARLVRHWQHHPISLPPVSKLNLDRANSSNPEDASGSGSGSRFVTPVVLSKVQHYLDTSAPSPLECGSSSAPQNAVTAAEQAAGASLS